MTVEQLKQLVAEKVQIEKRISELKSEENQEKINAAKAKAAQVLGKSAEVASVAKSAALQGLGKGIGWLGKITKSVRSEIADGIKSVQ
jgi:hypothetical protein